MNKQEQVQRMTTYMANFVSHIAKVLPDDIIKKLDELGAQRSLPFRSQCGSCPKPLELIKMPVMPPSSPRKMGTAKLRMTMASTSCAAMTANAPSSPRSKNSGRVTEAARAGGQKPCRRTRTAQTQNRGSEAPA